MPLDAQPIEYYSMYFTDEVTDICKETNRYAEQYIEGNAATVRPKSIVHDWKPTNRNEIKAFLGLCILMGNYTINVLVYRFILSHPYL